MKHLLLFGIGFLILKLSFSNEIITDSKISEAIVYLNGANVTRTAEINVRKGSHTLVFKGITTQLDPKSIQVETNVPVTLLSIQHEINFLEDLKTPKRIKELEDTLQVLTVQRMNEINGQTSYELELDFIISNKNIKGNQTISIDDVEEFTALYRKLIPELKSKILISQLLIDKLDKQIARVNRELSKHKRQVKQQESIIYIEIEADKPTQGNLNFSYYTQSAYWTPMYDIRANSLNEDIELTYKANVIQTTGNDWKEIKLALSTGNPSLSGTVPNLYTWNLDYYDEYQKEKNKKQYGRKAQAQAYSYNWGDKNNEGKTLEEVQVKGAFKSIGLDKAVSFSNNVGSNESGTNIYFNIDVPYTILSEHKGEMVEIQKSNVKADYEYYVVPKLDLDAFLVARLSNWDHLNLVPGESSIFFEGNYVGSSFIDPYETNDTLDISLGRDKGIVVKREKDSEKCKVSTFGGTKKHVIAYNISLRNNKKGNVKITVKDHIPVSVRKELEVSLDDNSTGDFDEKTGKIEWNINLVPGDKSELYYQYTVKHPRKKSVQLN